MHYSCDYRGENTGKLVVKNKKGFARLGTGKKKASTKVKIAEAAKEG
jgi:hypothetical protein